MAGTYDVLVSDANNCFQSYSIIITEPAAMSASIITNSSSCGGSDGMAGVSVYGGVQPLQFNWSYNNASGPVVSNLPAGSYSVTITDANGCQESKSVSVSERQPPIASILASSSVITLGSEVQLLASGGINYSWSPSSTLSCSDCNNPVAAPTETTTYCVVVKDANDCSATACETIDVDVICGEPFVPNAFSPNNDGANDVLYVQGNCISRMSLLIFNRWGEQVFQTSDKEIGWDGTYKGRNLDNGVFVYMLESSLSDGTVVRKKGNISLIK